MGKPVEIVKQWEDGTTEFMLRGKNIEVTIYTLGGIIQSIKVPDPEGVMADVVLGYDSPQEYGDFYLGGIIGRYSNRVARGKFTLDGKDYQLAMNNGPNHVHGGDCGFDRKPWEYGISGSRLTLTYTSVDMEENYPGTLTATVIYEVTEDDEIVIDYSATTDEPTIVCLSNHAFFNLEGHDKGHIHNHKLTLTSSEYTPMDVSRIPYGQVESVEGTDLDFRGGKMLSEDLLNSNGNDAFKGFDENFLLPGEPTAKRFVGRLAAGGRIMNTYTTQPAFALYTGYFMACPAGKSGAPYGKYSALCMFCQAYPDSPNQPQFPSVVLRPGEKYHHTTWYKFAADSQN